MLPIHTILHPTDFSPHSEYAFCMACSLARDYQARLVVLHVAEPALAVYGEGALFLPPPGAILEEARERLEHVRPPAPDIAVERRLKDGEPAVEIVRAAAEANADLVVMGTHGRRGLGRLLMGSVAEAVLRKAPCPVLTVKGPPVDAPARAQEPAHAATA